MSSDRYGCTYNVGLTGSTQNTIFKGSNSAQLGVLPTHKQHVCGHLDRKQSKPQKIWRFKVENHSTFSISVLIYQFWSTGCVYRSLF